MKSIIFLFFISIFLCAEPRNIAVIDLRPIGFESSYMEILSNKLRSDLIKTGIYRVIEREEMALVLEEREFQEIECVDNECAVEVGEILGVSHIVAGTVSKIGTTLYFNMKMVDVRTGEISTAVDKYTGNNMVILMQNDIPEMAYELAGIKKRPLPKASVSSSMVPLSHKPKKSNSFQWVRRIGGLSIAVAGITGGYLMNQKLEKTYDEYDAIKKNDQTLFQEKREEITTQKRNRNIFYGVGAVGAVGATLSLISIKF